MSKNNSLYSVRKTTNLAKVFSTEIMNHIMFMNIWFNHVYSVRKSTKLVKKAIKETLFKT